MKTVKHSYKVGDPVSYGFNGDWYPDGEVAKITKKFLITTRGNKYGLREINDRCQIDGEWQDCRREVFKSVNGGTWALTSGHINERNPHF